MFALSPLTTIIPHRMWHQKYDHCLLNSFMVSVHYPSHLTIISSSSIAIIQYIVMIKEKRKEKARSGERGMW